MSRRLTAVSSNANPQRFVVMSEGVVRASLTAVAVPNAPRAFYVDLPTGLGAAGDYQFVLYRTTGTAAAQAIPRSAGVFSWDGTDLVVLPTLAQITTAINVARSSVIADVAARHVTTRQIVTNARDAVLEDIDDLGAVVVGVGNDAAAARTVGEFNRRVLEANEQYDMLANGTGTAVKTDKDTGDVLVNKTVTSTPGCEQSTTITESP